MIKDLAEHQQSLNFAKASLRFTGVSGFVFWLTDDNDEQGGEKKTHLKICTLWAVNKRNKSPRIGNKGPIISCFQPRLLKSSYSQKAAIMLTD